MKPIKAMSKKTIWKYKMSMHNAKVLKFILKYDMDKYAGIEEHAGHFPAHVWQRVLEERHS